jgi:hypothetical protein
MYLSQLRSAHQVDPCACEGVLSIVGANSKFMVMAEFLGRPESDECERPLAQLDGPHGP